MASHRKKCVPRANNACGPFLVAIEVVERCSSAWNRRVVPLFSRDFPVFSPVPHDPRLGRPGMQDWPHQNGEVITRVVITEVVSTKSPQNPGKTRLCPAWGHPDPSVWLTGPTARFPVSPARFPVPPHQPVHAPPPCSRRGPVPTGRGHSPYTPSPTVVRSWPGTSPPDPSGGSPFVRLIRSSFVNPSQPLGREARSFAPARPQF